MNPRLVVIVGPSGVNRVQLVHRDPEEERAAYALYQQVRPFLGRINKALHKSPEDLFPENQKNNEGE